MPKKERARRASSLMAKDPYTFIITLDKQVGGRAIFNTWADLILES